MRFSVDWLDDARNAALEERTTVADFRLLLSNQNACLHIEDGVVSDAVTISLYPLAEGLAHDWWMIFGGRDREVSLLRRRSGYATPEVVMKFDGAVFEARAEQRVYDNPAVRFWTVPAEIMDRASAEAELDRFVGEVGARLEGDGQRDTSAQLRWRRVRASRDDPDEAAFCEAAGALGEDPYAIDRRAAASIEAAGERFTGEPLTEFLAGSAEIDQSRLLDWVDAAGHRRPNASLVAELRPLGREAAVRAVQPIDGPEPGWALGYRRARALRRILDLNLGDRFGTFRPLAERLGARSFEVMREVEGLQALRTDGRDGVHIHLRSLGGSARSPNYLFAFSRAVGDAMCFPEPGNAAINELRSAHRQAAGRAFAAEFLAPIDEIRSMRRDGRDTLSIAGDLGVSAAVIEHQEENAVRIEAVCG